MFTRFTKPSARRLARLILGTGLAIPGLILVLPVVLLLLPFWGIAAATRDLAYLFSPRVVPWQSLIEFASEVGWKPRANADAHVMVDEVFHVTTDSDGWRGRSRVEEAKIVVFGDSFAFGYGIDDRHFFADVNPRMCTKAIGAQGYNMVQELLWMRRLAAQLRGKLVVWMVYYGNDLYENLQPNMQHYRMPFVRKGLQDAGWQIECRHVRNEPWHVTSRLCYYEKLAQLCSPSALSARAYDACDYLLGEGQRLCEQAGASLVIMSIPDVDQLRADGLERLRGCVPGADPDYPDTCLGSVCERRGLPFVALKQHLTIADFKRRDVHWNARGHRRVARLLQQLHLRFHPQTDPAPRVVSSELVWEGAHS